MTMNDICKRLAISAVAALGLSTGATIAPAYAQPGYDEAAGGGSEVTVQAPRPVGHRGYLGAPGPVTESVAVYYGDLDLNAPWGVRTLRARIVRAADRVCADLDYQPGLIPEERFDCVRPAVSNAMYQAPIPGWLRVRDRDDGHLY
jgi:UrcA family protein